MRNKAINKLAYTGIVTLSRYMGAKKIKILQVHNTGGSSLFDFLADCLVGDFTVARATRPTKIMLVKRSKSSDQAGNTSYSYESKSGFMHLIAKPEKVYNTIGSVIRYSFIIPKDTIESIDSVDFEGLGIGLYAEGIKDTELANYAAFCEINMTKNNLVNAYLVVDWELSISNITSNKTNE